MKGFKYISFTVVLLALLLSGCSKASKTYDWKDLKYVADNYTLEDARKDGYVIIEDSNVTYGEDTWQDFVDLTEEKKPCKVRVVHYYNIGDPARYDPAYYESIKDDYPKIYILELVYNGDTFSVSHYEGDKLYQSEFKYLMKYEGKAESPNSGHTSYVRYVLVNDDSVTWEDIMRGLLSSHMGAYIPHSQIYTKLIYREEHK